MRLKGASVCHDGLDLPVDIFFHIASFTSPCLVPEPAHVAAVHLIFTQRELIQLHHAGFGSNIKANGYRRALAWEQESRVTHDLPQYAQNSKKFSEREGEQEVSGS